MRFNEGHRMSPQVVRALTTQFAGQQNLQVRATFARASQGFSTQMDEARAADGTSMAAPFVSGALALIIDQNSDPFASPSDFISTLINDANVNTLSMIPAGTANKLLYIPDGGPVGGPGGGGPIPCPYMDENNNWVMCE